MGAYLRNGCYKICSLLILCLGSFFIRLSMNEIASFEMPSGYSSTVFYTFVKDKRVHSGSSSWFIYG